MELNFENSEQDTPVVEQEDPKFESSTVNPEEERRANGLSDNEYNDPNKIQVTIADKVAPIVVLFGPPSCGKTMTLIRLTRYLHSQGYEMSPIRSFRPTADSNYKEMCDGFDAMVSNPEAANSTNNISFMLVKVVRNGKTLCQILEAPGEYYHKPNDPFKPFPAYVNRIISGENRKVWALMVEPDWMDEQNRRDYVTKINNLKKKIRPKDKAIFVLNKIDKADHLIINTGKVHISEAIKTISDLYPNIFNEFKNQNPITRLWKTWNCDFVPFQTGDYNEANDGSVIFTEGPDIYPKMLWNSILNQIRG